MKKLFTKFTIIFALALIIPLTAFATSLSNYAENKIVDSVFRGIAFSESSPADYYIELESSACSDSASGTELSGGSYARVAIARSTAAWTGTHGTTTGASSGTNGTISNAAAITLPTATADWTTATHWEISDASTAGNAIVCAALTASRTITNGATAAFSIGALTIQIDN
jgi:hypothetical protein